jgi:hypothetical protein
MPKESLIISGIRILTLSPNSRYDYRIEHEFVGENWKVRAIHILPLFLDKMDVKFQTLHIFSSSYNIQSGIVSEPSLIWLDSPFFNFDDLISYD